MAAVRAALLVVWIRAVPPGGRAETDRSDANGLASLLHHTEFVAPRVPGREGEVRAPLRDCGDSRSDLLRARRRPCELRLTTGDR